jgi:hypothetical protein
LRSYRDVISSETRNLKIEISRRLRLLEMTVVQPMSSRPEGEISIRHRFWKTYRGERLTICFYCIFDGEIRGSIRACPLRNERPAMDSVSFYLVRKTQ